MLQIVIQESFKWCLYWSQYVHGTDSISRFFPYIYYITTETVYKVSKCHLKTSMSMGRFVRREWFLRPVEREEWCIPPLGMLIVNQCQYHPIIGTLELNMIIKAVHGWDIRRLQRVHNLVQWYVCCATSYELG